MKNPRTSAICHETSNDLSLFAWILTKRLPTERRKEREDRRSWHAGTRGCFSNDCRRSSHDSSVPGFLWPAIEAKRSKFCIRHDRLSGISIHTRKHEPRIPAGSGSGSGSQVYFYGSQKRDRCFQAWPGVTLSLSLFLFQVSVRLAPQGFKSTGSLNDSLRFMLLRVDSLFLPFPYTHATTIFFYKDSLLLLILIFETLDSIIFKQVWRRSRKCLIRGRWAVDITGISNGDYYLRSMSIVVSLLGECSPRF